MAALEQPVTAGEIYKEFKLNSLVLRKDALVAIQRTLRGYAGELRLAQRSAAFPAPDAGTGLARAPTSTSCCEGSLTTFKHTSSAEAVCGSHPCRCRDFHHPHTATLPHPQALLPLWTRTASQQW